MAITMEMAKANINEPAVVCCRVEAGSIISPDNLEDPVLFPDLVDSGLLELDENVLTIGQVLDAKLVNTLDSLTPIRAEDVQGINIVEKDAKEEVELEMETGTAKPATNLTLTNQHPVNPGVIKIHIGEGKDINLEIPMMAYAGPAQETPLVEERVPEQGGGKEEVESRKEDRVIRSLRKKYFQIDRVEFGPETRIDGKTLYIREDISQDACKVDKLVKEIKLEIIGPDKYKTYSETIMDVQPIASKEEGDNLGRGETRVLDGVIMMVTGTDEKGVQIGEFGSSEGILEENIMWGRPGAPDMGEIIIKTQVTIKENTNMERPGPLAAHKATDYISQEIREALKKLDDSLVTREEEFAQLRRPGKKKVVIVKEIMGQGAMHDNLILPMEPVGVLGAKPNVDLGNLPIVLSPLEILDGAIHALTCIGPSTKECSRHYFREPLIVEALKDEDIDLCGVVLVGSPQINSEKFYVSERLGMTIEAMDLDGAIVTTEGFGNNHIDFASHIEQIGRRNIPVVGASFCAVQGALVVGNKYMTHMIDLNKTEDGIENEILACNTLTEDDGIRILAMLKAAMDAEEVAGPERHWDPQVKENNLQIIEKSRGRKIQRPDNELSLPGRDK